MVNQVLIGMTVLGLVLGLFFGDAKFWLGMALLFAATAFSMFFVEPRLKRWLGIKAEKPSRD